MSHRHSAAVHVVVCAALVLLACDHAAAQGLVVGARAGSTMSSVSTSGEGDGAAFGNRFGVTAGGFVTWPMFGLELQLEGLFAQKGASLEQDGIDARLLIDYFELPVLARFSWPALGGRLYVGGGPAFAYRLRARTRAEFSGATEEIDASDDLKSTDIGIVAAAGFEWRRVVFDGRYTYGLLDIDADDSDAVKVKNRALSLTAGIRF